MFLLIAVGLMFDVPSLVATGVAGAPDSAIVAAGSRHPSSAELDALRSRLRGRSTARIAHDGAWLVVSEPRATPEGIRFARSETPGASSPIPWTAIDTVWVRGDRAAAFAWLGLFAGGVLARTLAGSQSAAGDYAGLAIVSLTGTGAVVGAATGALVGSRLRTWQRIWPADAPRARGGGSGS